MLMWWMVCAQANFSWQGDLKCRAVDSSGMDIAVTVTERELIVEGKWW